MKKTKAIDSKVKKVAADVQEALPQSESFDALRRRVADALQNKIRIEANDANCYCWIQDLYPDKVVYSQQGELYQRGYSEDAAGVVNFPDDPIAVEMAYEPVAESHRVRADESLPFAEGAYDAKNGVLTLTVIKPGFNTSKKRFYPAEVLKRDHKIFENAKMFADHQTDGEARQRPEGSVHNWVASVKKVVSESDGTIKAEAAVIDPPFKAKLEELDKQGLLHTMGISIRAIGEATPSKVNGVETDYVESLVQARSVDFVTYAGAGGRVETMESDHNDELDVDLVSEAELRKRRPDLIQLIESSTQSQEGTLQKTLEQQLQEANTQLADSKKENEKLTAQIKEANKKTAAAELEKLLAESKLPSKAVEKLKKQFATAESADGMKEAIELEKEYVKEVLGGSGIRNMGTKANGVQESDTVSADDVKARKQKMKEAYMKNGLSEKEADIAVGA